jgi:PadR family transcriptional regulator, regulatory protein AphA
MQDFEINLTPTSYIVLGLLELAGQATPYDLKRIVGESIGDFWSVQHAQLYTEPERLALAGLVIENRELTGRRRRRYEITDLGREALARWREDPTEALCELRDPGLLQLFFGTDPQALSARQLPVHAAKLAHYEALLAQMPAETPRGPRLALEAGIGHEREFVRFWTELATADGS